MEQEQDQNTEEQVMRTNGVLRSVGRVVFWPFGIVVRLCRGFLWALGFRQTKTVHVTHAVCSPARQSLAGRKRLRPVTRLLLNILPRWVQGAMGYPVSSGIGRSLSPEVRVSPTKPCGKGSKRKQDELEEDEADEEERQTWVEALSQDLADEDPEEDPDYERGNLKIFVHRESLVNVGLCSQCMFCRRNASSPAVANVYACFYCSTETSSHINAGHFQPSSVETSSDEYRSHNNTESDIEINGCVAVIEDVNVDEETSTSSEVSCPSV